MRHPLALATAAIAIASAAYTCDAAAQPACLDIVVQNVRPQQGYLMLAAYIDAESYAAKKAAQSLRVAAPASAQATLQLCGVQSAEVAITMFQDLDGDGRMGTNVLRIPTEPWGASGTPGAFGPTWETARVPTATTPIVVKLTS